MVGPSGVSTAVHPYSDHGTVPRTLGMKRLLPMPENPLRVTAPLHTHAALWCSRVE